MRILKQNQHTILKRRERRSFLLFALFVPLSTAGIEIATTHFVVSGENILWAYICSFVITMTGASLIDNEMPLSGHTILGYSWAVALGATAYLFVWHFEASNPVLGSIILAFGFGMLLLMQAGKAVHIRYTRFTENMKIIDQTPKDL